MDVEPAMEFRARVARVTTIPQGTGVSYGGRFVATDETRIATLNAGYADGLPRTDGMRERGFARFGDAPLPVAGTVCMDLTMLDVSDVPGVRGGDEAVFLGPQEGALGRELITAEEIAELTGTIPWEVLTSVSRRVPRFYREP